jgi:hypothetical protein
MKLFAVLSKKMERRVNSQKSRRGTAFCGPQLLPVTQFCSAARRPAYPSPGAGRDGAIAPAFPALRREWIDVCVGLFGEHPVFPSSQPLAQIIRLET